MGMQCYQFSVRNASKKIPIPIKVWVHTENIVLVVFAIHSAQSAHLVNRKTARFVDQANKPLVFLVL